MILEHLSFDFVWKWWPTFNDKRKTECLIRNFAIVLLMRQKKSCFGSQPNSLAIFKKPVCWVIILCSTLANNTTKHIKKGSKLQKSSKFVSADCLQRFVDLISFWHPRIFNANSLFYSSFEPFTVPLFFVGRHRRAKLY